LPIGRTRLETGSRRGTVTATPEFTPALPYRVEVLILPSLPWWGILPRSPDLHPGRRRDASLLRRLRSWGKPLLFPLSYLIFRGLHLTLRIRHIDVHHRDAAGGATGSYVLASLHENLPLAMMSQRNNPCLGLAADSDAGRIGAFLARCYGTAAVLARPRGSDGRDRGGRAALDAMIAAAERGLPLAITVDGPGGPRREVRPGVIHLGSAGRVPLLPFAAVAARSWRLGTWDRMRIPLPFSRVVVQYGEPVLVPPHLSEDEFRGHQEDFARRLAAVDRSARESADT
jgi:hypothetical protein